jgi:hypothetical protein
MRVGYSLIVPHPAYTATVIQKYFLFHWLVTPMRSLYVISILLALLVAGAGISGCTDTSSPAAGSPASPVSVSPGQGTPAPAGYPDLKGTWKSDDGRVYLLDDGVQTMAAGDNVWVITSQEGTAISGYKVYASGGTRQKETLVGIFDPEGKTLSFIDQSGGLAKGTLTGQDTLVIALMNPGDKSSTTTTVAVTMTLHRQK